MTDTPDLTPAEADDALAAEYVLGVLDLAERMAVERRLKADPGFAARVTAWETRMAGLNDGFADAAPPPGLLNTVEARLFPAVAKPRGRWRIWAGAAVAAGVVALGLAIMVPKPGPGPQLLAELVSQDQTLVYQAAYQDGALQVSRKAGTGPGTGQDHELWLIAPGAAPVSLGLLGEAPLTVRGPRPTTGWVLAVSVEPSGGSTTGAPTGPVILTAEIGA